jgi:hypothetical protein
MKLKLIYHKTLNCFYNFVDFPVNLIKLTLKIAKNFTVQKRKNLTLGFRCKVFIAPQFAAPRVNKKKKRNKC